MRTHGFDAADGNFHADLFGLVARARNSSIIAWGTDMPGILAFMNSAIFAFRKSRMPASTLTLNWRTLFMNAANCSGL